MISEGIAVFVALAWLIISFASCTFLGSEGFIFSRRRPAINPPLSLRKCSTAFICIVSLMTAVTRAAMISTAAGYTKYVIQTGVSVGDLILPLISLTSRPKD